MGNSDKVKPGEIVFALGNPFGLRGSITQGIVSAVSRKTQRSYGYDFIQTDAAINPGNSGGALVNIYGQLIGINRMIYTRTGGYMGIGFAIPVNRVKEVVKMIIKHGKVTRGYLGIIPANPDSETSRKMNLKAGVKIAEVIPDSPAEKAGLKPWDVIIRVNGKRIKSFSTLKRIISLKRPGSRIRIRVKRQNKIRRFTVRLADRSKALDSEINEGLNRGRGERNSGNALSMYGMTLKNLSPAQKRSVRVRYGVVVTNVKPNSPAMNSGLRPGDVILEIESLKMTSISRAKSILRSVQRKKAFQIRIKRNNRIRFIVIEK
jgi:S1-C subfamily serine protease